MILQRVLNQLDVNTFLFKTRINLSIGYVRLDVAQIVVQADP